MDYALIRAATPLEAVLQIQRDALGLRNVRCRGGQIVFKDAEMQAACAGEWRVVPTAQNGRRRLEHKVVIPEPSGLRLRLKACPSSCRSPEPSGRLVDGAPLQHKHIIAQR